jgi:hypothetical protein
MIAGEGFPTSIMLGPNTRAWRLDEVEAWLASRPMARKIVNPMSAEAKAKRAEVAAAKKAVRQKEAA